MIEGDYFMKISVIITTYNQQQQTDLVLQSLNEQKKIDLSHIEVIVVDDGSFMTYEPIETHFKLVVIHQVNAGRAAARNKGIQAATHDILIFVDGDRVVDEQFIYHYMTQYKEGLNIGRVKEIYSRDLSDYKLIKEKIIRNQARMPAYIYHTSILYDQCGLSDSGIIWITTFSGNMCISKKLIEKAGLFNESFENWGFEHFELGYRLHQLNVPFFQVDAVNYHLAHARDLNELEKNIRDSISHFMALHHDLILEKLQAFLLGTLALQDLEINKKANWLKDHSEAIYTKAGERGVAK